MEIRIKWFITTEIGQTKDPGRKLFRRFQAGFLEMEKTLKEEDLVRLDLTTRPLWVQELAKELIEEELRQAENITEFIVILYFKPWFQCTLASEAALSDLTFLCLLQRRYRWGKYNISLNSSPSPGCPRCGRCWRPSTASCGTLPGR